MAMLGENDAKVAQVIREADLVIPDGAGIVIYLKLRGKKQTRCPGIELSESLITELGMQGESSPIAFFGGKPGITEQAASNWQKKIPNIRILSNHGYLSSQEMSDWIEVLKDQQPRLILVGLGVPRQEYWIREHRYLCPQAIWVGWGAVLISGPGQKSAPLAFSVTII